MKLSKKLISSLALVSTASMTFSIASCACTGNEYVGLVITTNPAKINYAKGELLDLTGLEVKAVKADGTNVSTKDYTTDIADKTRLNEVGTKTITVKLNNTNFTDTFNIEVGQAVVTNLEITQYPEDKDLVFEIGQTLQLPGLIIKATKSDGEVINDFKGYNTNPAIGSTLSEWGKNIITFSADRATTSLKVLVITDPVKFSQCTWEILADWAYFYELGIIDESTFLEHFLDDNGNQYTSLEQFIGLKKVVNINGQSHEVKIIGINHDTIDSDLVEENTTALFTFQFSNKISKSDGSFISSIFDDQIDKIDYLNSQIRYNLNKTGSSTKQINWENDSTETRSLFEMLPKEFDNYIWPIKKKVAVRISNEMSIKEYTDRLFMPTPTEYAQEDSYFMVEGVKYKWWNDNNTDEARQIEDVAKTEAGAKASYFTPSAIVPTHESNLVCLIKNDKQNPGFGGFNPKYPQSIVPCFCI